MKPALFFVVPGVPVGKGRPRVGRVAGRPRLFTPDKTASYESRVALAAHQALAGAPMFEGPCCLRMQIDCQIPASWSGKKQAGAAAGEVRPTTKPDIDNVIKAVCDALNGVAWKDDVQLVAVSVVKRYAETPGLLVLVEDASGALVKHRNFGNLHTSGETRMENGEICA